MRKQKFILVLLLALRVVTVVAQEVNEADYKPLIRLPKGIVPYYYGVTLTVTKPKPEDDESKFSVQQGKVKIFMRAKDFNVDKIVLHAHPTLNINDLQLEQGGLEPATRPLFTYNPTNHELTVPLRRKVKHVGDKLDLIIDYTWHLVNINGTGCNHSCRAEGAFENFHYHILTQMEANHLRKVFPSFDEPSFKARFKQYATARKVRRQLLFETTRIMSPYLVAIAAPKNLDSTNLYSFPYEHIRIRIWTIDYLDKKQSLMSRTEAVIKHVLKSMEKHTGFKYPLPKLDIAITTDGPAGMENWGLIITRLELRTIIHELVHNWFGNLVTCEWWDDIWLNEGLTTYYTYLMQMETNFGEEANSLSGVAEVLPRLPAVGANQLLSSVDSKGSFHDWVQIAYGKGSVVARLIHLAMGNEKFHGKINSYLKKFQYSTATSSDFIAVLSEGETRQVKEMMETFIYKDSWPKIVAKYVANAHEIRLEQRDNGTIDRALTDWTLPFWFRRHFNARGEELIWMEKTAKVTVIKLKIDEKAEDFSFKMSSCNGLYAIEVDFLKDDQVKCDFDDDQHKSGGGASEKSKYWFWSENKT